MGGVIASIVVTVALVIAIYFVVCEAKRKAADLLWQIKPEELHFEEPAEVLGHGTFGLVLLAEYRGTQVAIKRVMPQRSGGSSSDMTTPEQSIVLENGDFMGSRFLSYNGHTPKRKNKTMRKMKEEFLEEMRQLSKLRHPCVTTVMGACMAVGGKQEPMLVMEFMTLGSLYDVIHNHTICVLGKNIKF